MVYLGFVMGNFTGIYSFPRFPSKIIIVSACLFFTFGTLLFVLGNAVGTMCLARVFTGFA